MKKRIWFDKVTRSRQQISMTFGIDDLRFEVAYWYGDVNFHLLEEKYGAEFMKKVYFHMMAFEINKLVSFNAGLVDFGDFQRFYTKEFDEVWRAIVKKVWAQWRFENNIPYYEGPVAATQPVESSRGAIENELGQTEILSFCGGGKDSLVAMKLLERAGIPFSSFAYSNSIYGTASHQHALITNLLNHANPVKRHQQWVYDSFADSPVLQLYREYGVSSITAAETPSSVFAVLPIVLQHGYHHIALAHERSANVGNLIWPLTNEDVNHQWGKSYEAEVLLNDYIRRELISNFSYFSILQPIYDVTIFNLVRKDLEGVVDTHSCNLSKPWCSKCPKCAYVWLNYMAYLPVDLVDSIFETNLFDIEENQRWYFEMLGLAEHTPFECIGQVSEVRLAFEICKRKGLRGKAVDRYKAEFSDLEIVPILDKYLDVDGKNNNIPPQYLEAVLPQMKSAAADAYDYILKFTT